MFLLVWNLKDAGIVEAQAWLVYWNRVVQAHIILEILLMINIRELVYLLVNLWFCCCLRYLLTRALWVFVLLVLIVVELVSLYRYVIDPHYITFNESLFIWLWSVCFMLFLFAVFSMRSFSSWLTEVINFLMNVDFVMIFCLLSCLLVSFYHEEFVLYDFSFFQFEFCFRIVI